LEGEEAGHSRSVEFHAQAVNLEQLDKAEDGDQQRAEDPEGNSNAGPEPKQEDSEGR
jgi:hypothetical protein